ncbi:methyltransferase family protein [Hyphococcus sp.]|jgi:protein-S-isoprenylcysteine O-methyltransferase Ste14|uniref:methyltransferase family protein n=1 Tax=Hyphococcus sp. TaxID=2038636 RepID=UPI003D0CB0AB
MSQSTLAWLTALIVIALMGWMIGFGVMLRRSGVNPNAVAERNTNWMQRFLVAGAGLLDLYFIFRAPFPVLDDLVAARPSPAPWAAVGFLVVGAVIILASQAGMGRSWRVGVPRETNHVDALVTGGLNRLSRNPVYLGVMIFLTGGLLAAPGPLTAVGVIVSFIGLTIIIRQEERYLSARFGADYDAYRRRVRRWI